MVNDYFLRFRFFFRARLLLVAIEGRFFVSFKAIFVDFWIITTLRMLASFGNGSAHSWPAGSLGSVNSHSIARTRTAPESRTAALSLVLNFGSHRCESGIFVAFTQTGAYLINSEPQVSSINTSRPEMLTILSSDRIPDERGRKERLADAFVCKVSSFYHSWKKGKKLRFQTQRLRLHFETLISSSVFKSRSLPFLRFRKYLYIKSETNRVATLYSRTESLIFPILWPLSR